MEPHPIFKHAPTQASTAIRRAVAGETTIINKCQSLLREGIVQDPVKIMQLKTELANAQAHRRAWWAILKAMCDSKGQR